MLNYLVEDTLIFDNLGSISTGTTGAAVSTGAAGSGPPNVIRDDVKRFPAQFIFLKKMKCVNTNIYQKDKSKDAIRTRLTSISYDKINHYEDEINDQKKKEDRKNVQKQLYTYYTKDEGNSAYIFNQALKDANFLRNQAEKVENTDSDYLQNGVLGTINFYNRMIQKHNQDPEIKKRFMQLNRYYNTKIGNLCDVINNMLIEEAFLVDEKKLNTLEDLNFNNNNNSDRAPNNSSNNNDDNDDNNDN